MTTLNPVAIRCHNCGQEMTTFARWFSENCPSAAATGHSLDWPEIMLLEFRNGGRP